MRDIEEIREEFSHDRFATKCAGIFIEEAGPNYAKCSLKIGDDHKNAMGRVMGGAIYTLADFAFAVAANNEKVSTVSVQSNISFLGAAKGDTLIAVAQPIKVGRKISVYSITITDDLGTNVAYVTATGAGI